MKTWTFILALALLSLVAAKESCVSRGLKAHGDRVPFEAVGSTDPNIPLDPRLFDFNFYASKTPHTYATQDEADDMAAELCGENKLSTVLLGPDHKVEEGLAEEKKMFNDLLVTEEVEEEVEHGPGPEAQPMMCSSLPNRVCSYGKASCGARGYDAGQCPGNWWCCKEGSPPPDVQPMPCRSFPGRMCSWGRSSCGTKGYDAWQCPTNWWCCKDQDGQTQAAPANTEAQSPPADVQTSQQPQDAAPAGTVPEDASANTVTPPAVTDDSGMSPASNQTSPDGQEPMPCKNDPDRMCSFGADSCGANGFDEGECEGEWRCCKDARRATGFSGVSNVDATGVTLGHNHLPAAAANSTQIVGLRGNTFSGSISDFPIPIPVFPVLKVTLGASLSVTQSPSSFGFSGRLSVGLAFDIKVVRVSAYIALSGSVSTSSVTVRGMFRPASVLKSYKSAALYSTFAQLTAVKAIVNTVADGLTSALKSTNTPSRPTEALRLYAEGFNQEYVDLFSDEWTFVTSESPLVWPNRPSDAVIIEALRRIERMLQVTPTQRPDGSIVWQYTASSEWLSTKLFYKLNRDNSWQWSPDDKNWMPMNQMTVRGGRWNGQKPTDDNQKTIQAIHLIYVQNPSLAAMLRDGAGSSALEVTTNDKWPEWLDNAIGRGSQALTDAGKRLVAFARRQFSNFNEFWNKIKAGIRETGAFRFVQRRFFRNDAPKKPMRVFAELAERMRVEGFGSEGLAARAFFTADAVLFRDFTRILSMRESVYAFCYKNKDIADKVGEHMDRIVAARRAQSSGARTSVFQSNTDKIRIDAVKRELVARDGGQAAVAAGDEAAKRLFGKIAPELAERFEQIRTMANMVAQRLRNRGDPLWSSLNTAEKKEYSDHFLRIRGLVGNLHSFLVEVNRGDGWLKRGLLGGISYIKTHVATLMDQGRAKLREIMERDAVKVTLTTAIEIGVGFSPAVPAPPGVPSGSISLQVAAQAGWVGVMDPSAFSDPNKTVNGPYTGITGTASGSVTNGGTKQLKASLSFTRTVPSNQRACTALLMPGLTDCTILSTSLTVSFPGNMGLSVNTVRGIAIAALTVGAAGTGAQDDKWKVIVQSLINPLVPGAGGTGSNIEPADRVHLVLSALADVILPAVVVMGNPFGSPSMSLKLDVGLYWAKKSGADVWGCNNLRLGFGFSGTSDVTAKISEWTNALAGAKVSISAETGIFFDIKALVFKNGSEWPATGAASVPALAAPAGGGNAPAARDAAAPAADADAPATVDASTPADGATDAAVSISSKVLSRDCDPSVLAKRIASIRAAANESAEDPTVGANLLRSLNDLERRFKTKCGGSISRQD